MKRGCLSLLAGMTIFAPGARLAIDQLATTTQSRLFFQFQYATGENPVSVATGDFNRDGNPDVAVVNSGSNTVSVFLGNGDGTFQGPAEYPTSFSPYSIAVGDFNGDGKADLITGNVGSDISVLLGNGDGTFQGHVDYPLGFQGFSVAAGDFNGDGHLDVAVTGASLVSVFMGNGDGTFQPRGVYATGGVPSFGVAVGDFNGDGKLDLVTANCSGDASCVAPGTVSVLLGNGDGTFQAHVDFPTGGGPVYVAVGDFNTDGRLDLAVANSGSNTVSVMLGNGDGSFQAHVDYPTGVNCRWVELGDFNGDAHMDLGVANSNSNTLSVLLGNGDGTFRAHSDNATGAGPIGVAVADFNRDGHVDVVIANSGSNTVSMLLGKGDSTFQTGNYLTGLGPDSVAVADFNDDGKPDLAFANYLSNNVSVLLGNGDGTPQAHSDYASGEQPASVATGDFNHDGKPDIVVVNSASNTVSVLLGKGDGTFKAHLDSATGIDPASGISLTSLAVGDFNGDGVPDLAVAGGNNFLFSGSVVVLLGNVNGTFQTGMVVSHASNAPTVGVAVGDFNGDGKADLALVHPCFKACIYGGGSVGVLLGNGDGTFQPEVGYTFPTMSPTSVSVADFNSDGKPDLAVTVGDVVAVMLGQGDGTFQAPVNYPTGKVGGSLAAAVGDFDHDGHLDLAVTTSGPNLSLLLGNGDGTFQAATNYLTGVSSFVALADLSGPGSPDLIIANPSSSSPPGTISILLNVKGSVLALQSSTNPSDLGQLVNFTATVRPTVMGVGIVVPTGTVTFRDGATGLGSSALDARGITTYSTATLSAGGHAITAGYSGDNNFNPNTSSNLSQVVKAPDFGVSASPSDATVPSGGSANFSITATAVNGFNGIVSLNCSVSPTPVFAPACSLNPTSVTPAANGTATSTLTVATTTSTAGLVHPKLFQKSRFSNALWLPGSTLIFLAIQLGTKPSRKKRLLRCLLLGVLVVGFVLQSACAGGGNHRGTPVGSYAITVTATSGATMHTVSTTLTVQ